MWVSGREGYLKSDQGYVIRLTGTLTIYLPLDTCKNNADKMVQWVLIGEGSHLLVYVDPYLV
jgi:hypothetical protein